MAKDVAMSPQFSSSISGSGYALPEIAVKTKTNKQRKPADAHFCRLALLCVENKNTATAEQLRYKNPRPRCCVVVDTSGISTATGCNAPCFEGMLVSLGYSFELVSEQYYNNCASFLMFPAEDTDGIDDPIHLPEGHTMHSLVQILKGSFHGIRILRSW